MAVKTKALIKLDFETDDIPDQSQYEDLIDSLAHVNDVPTNTDLSDHTGDTNNPHGVTKAQVGLGAVDNTADAAKPVSAAQQAAIDAHANSTSNPHGVTKSDVGLANAENTSDANKPVSTAQQAAIDAHANLTNNPHGVTQSQVGLGNVNNTSDANKPVSTAQQAAIDAHANRVDNPHGTTAGQLGLAQRFGAVILMQQGTFADNETCITDGYHTKGDGGDNVYIYKSTGRGQINMDGGFYLPGEGADDYFRAVDQTIANVKKFGALGLNNPIQDDWAAIQSAINTQRPVFIPKGTYFISQTLTLNCEGGETAFKITGEGVDLSVIRPTDLKSDSTPMIQAINCDSAESPKHSLAWSHFADFLVLNKSPDDSVGTYGIDVDVCQHTSFERVRVSEATIACMRFGFSFSNRAEDCTFQNSARFGIIADDQVFNQFTARACSFLSNGDAGFYCVGGNGLNFVGCGFELNGSARRGSIECWDWRSRAGTSRTTATRLTRSRAWMADRSPVPTGRYKRISPSRDTERRRPMNCRWILAERDSVRVSRLTARFGHLAPATWLHSACLVALE